MKLYKKRHKDDTETFWRTSDWEIIGQDKTEAWAEFQLWLAQGNTPDPADDEDDTRIITFISDRQFFQQAAIQGFISQEDALQAVKTGFIPAPLQAIVDTITDPTDKFNAEMLLSGATEFQRNHPLTSVIGTAFGMTEEDINTFFRSASNL
jgi:hypothetical protein